MKTRKKYDDYEDCFLLDHLADMPIYLYFFQTLYIQKIIKIKEKQL